LHLCESFYCIQINIIIAYHMCTHTKLNIKEKFYIVGAFRKRNVLVFTMEQSIPGVRRYSRTATHGERAHKLNIIGYKIQYNSSRLKIRPHICQLKEKYRLSCAASF
jgi:hypothetical protein